MEEWGQLAVGSRVSNRLRRSADGVNSSREDSETKHSEAGRQSPSLHRLPERPFRTVPGGNLRKFLRGLSQFSLSFLGACPTLTFLLRRTIRNHLRRSRPEKILNVFQRIRLRFFQACGLASGRASFAVTKPMSDRLLASLDGRPVPPANCAPGSATPGREGDRCWWMENLKVSFHQAQLAGISQKFPQTLPQSLFVATW